jgi:hypothetical protein
MDAKSPRPLVLAGRITGQKGGTRHLELMDGLTIDLADGDVETIEETTDPVTLQAKVTVTLTGHRPITATFEPHLYRVLAQSPTLPFVFSGASRPEADDFVLGLAYVSARQSGGGGGTPDHDTRMMCTTWMGTTKEDGIKGDSPGEPDEIHLP